MQKTSASVRIFPHDWLSPLPLDSIFGWDGHVPRPPLEVDVGCGKGRFLLARATANPQADFLGIDRMLRRVRKVDNKARRLGLANIRLLRMEAYYAVAYLIPPMAVTTYYIFFPDPWPKKRHHEHRLFNPRFVEALHLTLAPGGKVHFTTDHLPYFGEVKAILSADLRFLEVEPFEPSEDERTDFERYYESRTPIGRLSLQKAS
jgi:tRNA (guanine-N7-)-methyltransferase